VPIWQFLSASQTLRLIVSAIRAGARHRDRGPRAARVELRGGTRVVDRCRGLPPEQAFVDADALAARLEQAPRYEELMLGEGAEESGAGEPSVSGRSPRSLPSRRSSSTAACMTGSSRSVRRASAATRCCSWPTVPDAPNARSRS
jgi:hypothetical protein